MDETTTIVFLHGLGCSGRAFEPVAALLPEGTRVVALDLPGHGDNPMREALTVAHTAEWVHERIAAETTGGYLLVAHSMGGKIASVLTAQALRGGGPSPRALVLLAPSPPTPEPMAEDRRRSMLSWVADDLAIDEPEAREFVTQNVGAALSPDDERRAIEDVRRTAPHAWRAWLESGSREDVSATVGVIGLPAVIVGGTSDDDLGAGAQRTLHGAVYPQAEFVDLPGAGHLLTYERPAEVAAAIVGVAHRAV